MLERIFFSLLAYAYLQISKRRDFVCEEDTAFYERKYRGKYRTAFKKFIVAAQNGNVNLMLRLTTPLSMRQPTKPVVQNLYETQIIPAFRDTTITWHQKAELTTDETGCLGFTFSGNASGTTTFSFYVTVMQDKGHLGITTVRI